MHLTSLAIIITLVLASFTSLRADAILQIVPSCLAGFCLESGNLPTEEAVNARFGGSRQELASWNAIAYCYKFIVADQRTSYGYFEFKMRDGTDWQLVTIRLSQESLCLNADVVTIKSELSTKEGVRLGSDGVEMIRFYGQPKYVINQPSEAVVRDFFSSLSKVKIDSISQYVSNDNKDLSSARFYFSNKQLIGIEISIDE